MQGQGDAHRPQHAHQTCAGGATCKSAGKHPRTPNGFRDASADPEQVHRWWARWPSANIGGAMGSPGNLVAFDVDPRHGGDASFSDLVEAHGDEWLETLTHRTGSGGFHLFFQYALDVELRNSAGKVGPGIDTRGEGGTSFYLPLFTSPAGAMKC